MITEQVVNVVQQVEPPHREFKDVIDLSHIDLKEISDVKRYYSLLQELSTITKRSILVATQK